MFDGYTQGAYVRSVYKIIDKVMPALNATTTAVFSAIGLNASDIYGVFVSLIGTAVSFMLWMIQVSWPFLLGIAFVYLMYGMARKFTGFGR